MISKLKNFDNLLFLLISLVIFITVGNFIEDYKKIILLKLIIIFLIIFKINFFEETRIIINENKIISIILILFIISITISFITSPFKIHQFAFHWLRIRYLDTITDIFLFVFLYMYFKDRAINYDNLTKSIIIPGLGFSIFIIFTFISNQGLSDTIKRLYFLMGEEWLECLLHF